MTEDRHAVTGGVLKGARGGVRLCRSSESSQVSRHGIVRRGRRTIRPERQVRGDWKGELSLRQNPVPPVERQPVAAIKPPQVNEGGSSEIEEKGQSCQTQGVGTTVQGSAEEAWSKNRCEEMVIHFGNSNHRVCQLGDQATRVRLGPSQPLPLTNFFPPTCLIMMLNEALRLIRVYHNEKQKTLALALDISPSHLSEIESGKKHVTVELLAKYASHFRVPASSLMFFAERQGSGESEPRGNPIAAKIVKMLDWVETITRDREDPDETEVSR